MKPITQKTGHRCPPTGMAEKTAISLQRGPIDPKFHVEGVAPTIHWVLFALFASHLSFKKMLLIYLLLMIWNVVGCTSCSDEQSCQLWSRSFLLADPESNSTEKSDKTVSGCNVNEMYSYNLLCHLGTVQCCYLIIII